MESLLLHTFQLTPAQAELYASCFETREFKAGERFVEYGRISQVNKSQLRNPDL